MTDTHFDNLFKDIEDKDLYHFNKVLWDMNYTLEVELIRRIYDEVNKRQGADSRPASRGMGKAMPDEVKKKYVFFPGIVVDISCLECARIDKIPPRSVILTMKSGSQFWVDVDSAEKAESVLDDIYAALMS